MLEIGLPTNSDRLRLADLFLEDMIHLGAEVTHSSLLDLADSILAAIEAPEASVHCWVARLPESHGELPVGVILAHEFFSLKFGGKGLWIEELYVTPSARRHGIGRELVEFLLDFAETKNDILGIDLEAYHGNTPASILYRSLGFQRIGRERFSYRIRDTE